MTVLVTGGAGFVGHFIVEHLIAGGFDVAVAGRTPPHPELFSRPVPFLPLGLDPSGPDPAMLAGVSHLVHAAFDHLPGRYRGGEGGAPERFRRLNGDGSAALFRAARKAGAKGCIFLSSRAVYGVQPAGAALSEDAEPFPDTLYGSVKLEAERALTDLGGPDFAAVSLRVTGVYGAAAASRAGKWDGLFADWLEGRPVTPRCGTEVHGKDVARAVEIVLRAAPGVVPPVLNVSDLLVDRRDILSILAGRSGDTAALPAVADHARYNVMLTDRLERLGWVPGGRPLFEDTVHRLARDFLSRRAKGA